MDKVDLIIGRKIREFRLQNGLTLRECGELLNVKHSTYHGYETGYRSISAIDLAKLLNYYNVDINQFFAEIIAEEGMYDCSI